MRIVAWSKGSVSGETVVFRVYNSQGSLILQKFATEWVEGTYYIEVNNPPSGDYLVVATEINGRWVDKKHFSI